jgi:hypothetical protein
MGKIVKDEATRMGNIEKFKNTKKTTTEKKRCCCGIFSCW